MEIYEEKEQKKVLCPSGYEQILFNHCYTGYNNEESWLKSIMDFLHL